MKIRNFSPGVGAFRRRSILVTSLVSLSTLVIIGLRAKTPWTNNFTPTPFIPLPNILEVFYVVHI
jgi:hypothetical protein